MADLSIDGGDVVVALSVAERAEALHGDVRVPVGSITAVELVADVVGGPHGLKTVGADLPGVVAVGTFVHDGRRVFVAAHRAHRGGLRLTLRDEAYDELIVGLADPDGVAESIRAAGGPERT